MSTPQLLRATVVWTYDDYRQMPDDGIRYEVIDGDLHMTPAPSTSHQRASKRIQIELILQLERSGKAVVYDAPIDVIFSDTRTVQPDLIVVVNERANIISERGIEGAPDLVVEISSPGTSKRDHETKRKLYASEGVREYWLVDPIAKRFLILRLDVSGYAEAGSFGPGDRVRSEIFPELELYVDVVFAP